MEMPCTLFILRQDTHMTLEINDELVQHKKALGKIKTMEIKAKQMPAQT